MERKDCTLHHGDCYNILPTLEPESVDLIITDAPYGVGYVNQYTRTPHNAITNDKSIDYGSFIEACYRVLKPNSHAYFFTRFDTYPKYYEELTAKGFKVKNVLVIEKGHIGGIGDLNGSFANNSEWIVFAHKGRRCFEETKLLRNKKPIGKRTNRQGRPVKEWKTRFNTCWFGGDYPKSTHNATWQNHSTIKHPTAKNEGCIEWLVQISSKPGDIVLDPFMGSGSTGLAALNTGRHFIGIEIEENYYQLATERIIAPDT